MDCNEQNDKHYRNIGKFITEFSQICSHLQSGILHLLQMNGLKNQQLAYIMISSFAAYELQQTLRSIISELFELDEIDVKIIENIFSRIRKLIETRNDLSHATLYIGWGAVGQTDYSKFFQSKLHKNVKGAKTKNLTYDYAMFKKLIEETSNVAMITHRMCDCVSYDYSLKSNFAFDDVGNVVPKLSNS